MPRIWLSYSLRYFLKSQAMFSPKDLQNMYMKQKSLLSYSPLVKQDLDQDINILVSIICDYKLTNTSAVSLNPSSCYVNEITRQYQNPQ